jgi:hypothetical protein
MAKRTTFTFVALLVCWNVARAQGLNGSGLGVNRGQKFCQAHHTGPELEHLMATGQLGKDFIAGDVKAIDQRKLTIELLNGKNQQIEVGEKTLFCVQAKDSLLKAAPMNEIKVGDRVFGPGKLRHDIFVLSRVLYVLKF